MISHFLRSLKARRSISIMSIPRDVQEFLDGYPSSVNDASRTANIDFYQNQARCRPDRMLIEEIHDQYVFKMPLKVHEINFWLRWLGDYDTLEYNHGFIQWL